MANELKVLDEEFWGTGAWINAYCAELAKRIEQYSQSVCSVADQAIQDNLISAKLKNLASQAAELVPDLVEIGAGTQKRCAQFVEKIDTVDQFLY